MSKEKNYLDIYYILGPDGSSFEMDWVCEFCNLPYLEMKEIYIGENRPWCGNCQKYESTDRRELRMEAGSGYQAWIDLCVENRKKEKPSDMPYDIFYP